MAPGPLRASLGDATTAAKRLCPSRGSGRQRGRSVAEKLSVLVDGGKATPGPPLGPALGPLGVNIVEIIKAINKKTDAMQGKTLKARVLEVVGTSVSMGVTVEEKPAKELSKEIKAGKYDKQLAG